MEEIKLGDSVKDKVTGLKGIATSKTIFLNGCVQIEVTPKMKHGETTAEKLFGIGIDLQQLKKLGNGLNTPTKKVIKSNTGGRMRQVARRAY